MNEERTICTSEGIQGWRHSVYLFLTKGNETDLVSSF